MAAPVQPVTTTPAPPEQDRSLFANQGFRNVFLAAAVSTVATQISFLAIPLLAVTVLNATPAQVGLLGVLKALAFLLVGLPAGAWLDRVRRRGVMVAADLARAALLGSVAIAWWQGVLTLGQLYVVVLLSGVAMLFFDVAALSYLPAVVGRVRLVDANSKMQSWKAAATVTGPGFAGYLIQFASAPIAVLIDAVTYLWSALFLAGVRQREPELKRTVQRRLWDRCVIPETSTLSPGLVCGQIAWASSSNAAATRRAGGASTASS